jgi:hypothetical protein
MNSSSISRYFFILFIIGISTGCNTSTYERIKSYIDEIKVIDTHSHQGMPWKRKHNLFDAGLYLHTDLLSAGMPAYPDSMEIIHDAADFWDHTEKYLRFCRAGSYYAQFISNYKTLYGLDKPYLINEDFLKYSESMDERYKRYESWLDSCYKKLNIEMMFTDRLWQAFDVNVEEPYFGYVFRIDQLILQAHEFALLKRVNDRGALELLHMEEIQISNLESYLGFVDAVLKAITEHNVLSLKIGLAYHRSLDFEEVDFADAERIFRQPEFSDSDKKVLQDFLVFYIVDKAAEYNLPIQIHTGYLHGNYGWLDRGHPMKLLTLIRSNPKARFNLFHGGYPWTGDFIILGKNYPNVSLNLVWLPQLSRTRAIAVLHEILDAVPYNKIDWGGDVGNIDDAAGALELGREVVATVLAERMDRGWMTEEVARDVARRIFRENAIDIYRLKEKMDVGY